MAGATLRSLSLPRFALRRDEAAASLAISPSLFDRWVSEGLVPPGKKVKGVVLWDAEQVRIAWYSIFNADETAPKDDGKNPFDSLVA